MVGIACSAEVLVARQALPAAHAASGRSSRRRRAGRPSGPWRRHPARTRGRWPRGRAPAGTWLMPHSLLSIDRSEWQMPQYSTSTSTSSGAERSEVQVLQGQCLAGALGGPRLDGRHHALRICSSKGQTRYAGRRIEADEIAMIGRRRRAAGLAWPPSAGSVAPALRPQLRLEHVLADLPAELHRRPRIRCGSGCRRRRAHPPLRPRPATGWRSCVSPQAAVRLP